MKKRLLVCMSLFLSFFVLHKAIAQVDAKTADKIVESMGVATHINYASQTEVDTFLSPRLGEMGIRYIRDGGGSSVIPKFAKLYNDYGIKGVATMDIRDGWNKNTLVPNYLAKLVDYLDAAEGCNEWDVNRGIVYEGLGWPQNARQWHTDCYNAIKNYTNASDPVLQAKVRAIKVLAPSMADPANSAILGVVPCDFATTHSYPGSRGLPDADLDNKWIPSARIIGPGKQVYATETGYCHRTGCTSCCTNQGGVSKPTVAKYVLRHYMEYFNRGIVRDYFYNFQTRNDENWTPFFDSAKNRLPAFYAVKNFISIMKDPEAGDFTPGFLNYTITGDKSNLKECLVQKRDGRYYLLLWLNVSSWKASFPQEEINSSRNFTINFGATATSVKRYDPSFIGNNTISATNTWNNISSINTQVQDQVIVYEISIEGVEPSSGKINYQRWDSIPGNDVASLTGNANYPNNPTIVSELTSMEAALNVGDNYGGRLIGYIKAPVTGAYSFWIAGNEQSELWLSTNDSPANRVKVAYHNNATNVREWNKYPEQKSNPINLIAGTKYFVESIMKEGIGDDHLTVGWLKPGETGAEPSEVIPGSVLSLRDSILAIGVTLSPASATVNLNTTLRLTVTVTPANTTNKKLNWSSNDTNVATVSVSGLITPVAVGNTVITVTTQDGGFTASSTLTVAPALFPDLVVTNVILNPASPQTGEEVTLSAVVKNQGAGATPENVVIGVAFSVDGGSVAFTDTSILSLAAGASRTLTANGPAKSTWTAVIGTHTVSAQVDDANRIFETDNVNNTKTITVANIPGFVINPSTATVAIGIPLQVTAAIIPVEPLTWSSSDTTVATISATGLVNGIAEGNVVITVSNSDGSRQLTCSLLVKLPVLITSLTLNSTTELFETSTTRQLTATIVPDSATTKALNWTSSDPTVATVSTTGLVTPKNNGMAIITATTKDGTNLSATCNVIVNIYYVISNRVVSGNPDYIRDNAAGGATYSKTIISDNIRWSLEDYNGNKRFKNKATGNYLHNQDTLIGTGTSPVRPYVQAGIILNTDLSLQWAISNVDGTWRRFQSIYAPTRFMHKENSTGNIQHGVIQLGWFSAQWRLQPNKMVEAVSISPASVSIGVNLSQQLIAGFTPAANVITAVTWVSSDIAIATVSTTGVVTGKALGTATITVTTLDGNKTATSTVNVVTPVTGISISPVDGLLKVNETQQLTATITPANATNQSVTWSSSNTGIATVNSTGLVTAMAKGTASITATTQDENFATVYSVTVYSNTYQAEDRTAANRANTSSLNTGYTGTGYVEMLYKNGWLEWNSVMAPVAGTYTLTFRYANRFVPRPSQIIVNGSPAATIAFIPTGLWTNWITVSREVNLNAGVNTIRLAALTNLGGPNTDKLEVNDVMAGLKQGSIVSSAKEDGMITTKEPAIEGANIYPNPASNLITVESAIERGSISILSASGQKCIEKKINSRINQVNIKSLNAGIYLVIINGANTTITRKLPRVVR